jgi:hypothetical protein
LKGLDCFRAKPPQHRRVLAKVPLDCQDSDPHSLDCRFGRWPGR